MSKFEKKRKVSEIDYFHLINSILDVLIEFSLDLTITYINSQVYGVFGYSSEEIIGKNCIDFIHPDDRSRTIEIIKRAKKTKGIISTEIRIQHKKGYFIPTNAKGRLIEDDNQDKIVAVLRDITELKEAQHKLKVSDKKYREIIENIEDGYFEVDLHGNFTYVNDYICRYLGISKKDLIGKSYISILSKDSHKDVYEIFNLVYEKNLPKGTFESRVIRNDGYERTFEGTFYLRYDINRKKVGFYGFTRDITEQKEAVEKLKNSEEKYRKAYNRAELYKNLFYHDINNILSNIKLSIDLSERYLNEHGKEKEIKDLYEIIKNQFERGTKLISNVRKLSNLENVERSFKSVKVIKTLEEVIEYVQKSTTAMDINIKIDPSEKKINVRANEFLIEVFDNLLFNAINYNENSRKEILIKISRESKDNMKFIKFEFIDNGIGISDIRKKLIFQERLNIETDSKGMGFGLTLVKKIIESYKGDIWIEDRVKGDYSQGSNFIFLIPEAE
ncbi:MAG: PAS domain S-box protein [Candidatus Thorarchaeota archaeon]